MAAWDSTVLTSSRKNNVKVARVEWIFYDLTHHVWCSICVLLSELYHTNQLDSVGPPKAENRSVRAHSATEHAPGKVPAVLPAATS